MITTILVNGNKIFPLAKCEAPFVIRERKEGYLLIFPSRSSAYKSLDNVRKHLISNSQSFQYKRYKHIISSSFTATINL